MPNRQGHSRLCHCAALQAEKAAHQVDASRVKELETQLKATQASLTSEGALLQQASHD